MKTYQDALHYLYSFVSYERKTNWTYSNNTFNLARFHQLLDRLGNPQDAVMAIHVAGSDGKGSVCQMVATVLQSLGHTTGQYSSPHLQNVRERICINNEWISEQDFTKWTDHLRQTVQDMPPLPEGYATFFELLTAMAFLHFQRERVDFAIVETGLGGRLDATNVIKKPLVTAITRISLEHTDTLGDTLEAIADEKLGITRLDVPSVIGYQDEELIDHFKKRLNKQQAPVVLTDETYRVLSQKTRKRYRTLEIQRLIDNPIQRTLRIPLLGHYQVQNTVTALAVLDMLVRENAIPPISAIQLNRGFRRVKWPGRFEIIRRPGEPLMVLDVAHTAKGAAALRLSLDENFPERNRVFLLGFLKGKKAREMVRHLIRPTDKVMLTQAPTPRGMSIEMIQEQTGDLLNAIQHVESVPDPAQAFRQAERMTAKQSILIVAGSLYLVGEIRTFLGL